MDYMLKRNMSSKNTAAIITTAEDGTTEYCCVECPFKTEDKEDLERHLLVHNRGYRFVCGICGSGLKRREHYDRHTAEHQETRPHVCNECGKAFKRKEHLNIHSALHYGRKNKNCYICCKSFYRKDHLQKHIQTHRKTFIKHSIFSTENEEVKVKQELMDEILSVEGVEIKTEVQEEDSTSDAGNSSLLAGSLLQVGTKERPFVCLVCNKTYKRRDHLKLHSLTHMKLDKVCTECGKAFHKEDQLLVHMNTHLRLTETDTQGMFTLSSLLRDQGQIFAEDQNLLVPRPSSAKAEIRLHECDVCRKRFKRRQHLKVHMNIHLRETHQEDTVWCSFCNQVFSVNGGYEYHMCKMDADANVTGEGSESEQAHSTPLEKKENKYPFDFVEVNMGLPEDNLGVSRDERHLPVPQRVYVCKYCAKPFKRKDHYKIHLHIHTGIKSFFCPDCGKGFYRKDHMQKHMQIHNRPKPKVKRTVPDLFPISSLAKPNDVRPEITIHAPSNAKLRLPLQIKVPYQMVLSTDDGEQHAVTVNPRDLTPDVIIS